MAIESYSQRMSTHKRFKIDNIILAAPDMDIDVAYTRVRAIVSDPDLPFGDKVDYRASFHPEEIHLTVYASKNDTALNVSKEIFGSNFRLGQIAKEHHDKTDNSFNGAAEFISVDDESDMLGHGYFLSNPSVRRDIVSVIKDRTNADDERRSLVEIKKGFWQLAQ